ncbi:MAG: DUF1538 domain-containing protein [Candidatus Methanomethylophilaceae archaeon]|nr:DUF1538 domain-containing protein [Candidatus Methanomethylophilaceae archaeon]
MRPIREYLSETCRTALPITVLLLVIDTLFVGTNPFEFFLEITCVFLVFIGFTLFLYGVDLGIIPVGKYIGVQMSRGKSILSIILIVFIISVIVTVAEPDVTVFSSTVDFLFHDINYNMLVVSIAVGVGVMLVLAALRIYLDLSMKIMITIGYSLVIILGLIVPKYILGIAFDSGGVTTGPITIPVLMAMGMGIGMVASRNSDPMNSFGMVGLASIGPLITVMLYGQLANISDQIVTTVTEADVATVSIDTLTGHFIDSVLESLGSVLPLLLIFMIMMRYYLHGTWHDFVQMFSGMLFAMVGMILFLTGVYSGYMPMAQEIGVMLIDNGAGMWILALGLALGFLVIVAEPAVKILGSQVESVSRNIISARTVTMVVGIGVSVFVGVGMYVMSQGWMSIYYLLPIYGLAILLLWFMDDGLVGITYDAGGVATGPMSVAVIMSMYAAMAEALGGTIATENAFGVIALIALAPIIAFSILGIFIRVKKKSVRTK